MPAPCAAHLRHRWKFVRNVILQRSQMSVKGTSIELSLKGLYTCECGAKKYGNSLDNARDDLKK